MTPARILIIEDERDVTIVLCDLLQAEGYHVHASADGHAGLALAMSEPFELIILDLMLPGLNGLEICQRLRSHHFLGGILMLTARGSGVDKVQGLQNGADDYVVKPFAPDELIARLSSLLRRVRGHRHAPINAITFGRITANFSSQSFTRDGHPFDLSAKEATLLQHLVSHAGQILSREHLLQHVWPSQPHITPRTVDTHIAWLRKKIEVSPDNPLHIHTVRGEGYRFEV